jgi:heme/copper-type cytochrome/quinol oxidase subunit 3
VLWCYGCKFLPTVITVILSQCMSFLALCSIYAPQNSKCLYVYPDTASQIPWGGWAARPNVILAVQHFALVLIVLHFSNYLHSLLKRVYSRNYKISFSINIFLSVTISIGFVHREYSIWKKHPANNCTWFLSVLIV